MAGKLKDIEFYEIMSFKQKELSAYTKSSS